ncbi:splicing factor YJU2-like [Lolium rigidum]|uniref:splicing factor YJU2-like n=1 Tax=Lolium rigidum TaxID=89674 RepID=UPI001F5DDBE2|nr:splicing factor YJU2-like [Lolium rigidum]
MGERKPTNKYYPPDFDPSKLPSRRPPKNQQATVRMMLPMRVRCATCGEHLAPGTKFNSRKEDVPGERYLGAIPVYRFYIRCTRCSAEIAFKTDPKNSGYVVESGGFETRRGAAVEDNEAAAMGRREDCEDAMSALESRARDGVCEMAVDAAQEEMRSLRSRHARASQEQLLESLSHHRVAEDRKTSQELAEEDEKLISSTKFHCSKDFVFRIQEDEEEDEEEEDFFEELMARLATPEADCPEHKKQRKAAPAVSSEGFTGTTMEAKGKSNIHRDNNALRLLGCSYEDDSD